MSLRFIDSFDHYDSGAILNKWTRAVASTADYAISTTSQRTGRACLKVTGNGVWKTIDNQQTWTIGFAYFPTAAASIVVQVRDGLLDQCQDALKLNADGTWSVYRGDSLSVLLATSNPTYALHFNQYYYIEWQIKIGGTGTGSTILKQNGQTIISTSSINTQVNTNTFADSILFQGPGGSVFNYVDDLYICDGQILSTGNPNNTFLGDSRVGVLFPDAPGDATALTPVGTATVGTNTFVGTNWRDVNETIPDNDATYVTQSATGSHDLYGFQDVSASVIVFGAQSNITARKDDEGNRAVVLVSKPSVAGAAPVTEFTSTNTFFMNQTYIDYLDQFDINPATTNQWTAAEVNASQWGPKVGA